MTGDIKHNPTADLLIMTTEILQNYLFKKKNNFGNFDFDIDIENELECVIFDEVHYIDDPDRETVWEQVMIMLPNRIVKLLSLSANYWSKRSICGVDFANQIEGSCSLSIPVRGLFHYIFMIFLLVLQVYRE